MYLKFKWPTQMKPGIVSIVLSTSSQDLPLFLISSSCYKELTNVVVAILTDHWSACQTLLSEIKLA